MASKAKRGSARSRSQTASPLSAKLIHQVINEFQIDRRGPHGTAHWMRVRHNGLMLAQLTGANPRVVELFALFHDSQRENEDTDPEHGKRGALNAVRYRQMGMFDATEAELELVYKACWGHTYEDVDDPCITVLTCWDADRLDLGRVGIVPDPRRLFTQPARDPFVIDWACQRSVWWAERYY